MMRAFVVGLLLAGSVLTNGCAMQRKAAESAIIEVQSEYADIGEHAENLMPDEAKSLRDAIAQAKDDFERGNYGATIHATKSLRNRIKEMADRLPQKRNELETAWGQFESSIPKALTTLDRRFGSSNRPAYGDQRTVFDHYRRELRSVEALWDEARSARHVGRLAEAVTKAGDVKYRALRLFDATQTGS